MATDKIQQERDDAVAILKAILLESLVETEDDRDIYNFLKRIDELPVDYKPYWENDD